MKLMEFPLTLAAVQAWNMPAFEDLVSGLGEQAGAVFDFTGMYFTRTETRLIVVAYRNLAAWQAGHQLPGFPVIELHLTRAEHLALAAQNQAFADLETAVREAAWSLITTHPKMLRGAAPAQGEEDTRQNVFHAGTLAEVS